MGVADTLTPGHRSWVMSRIRSGDTKPEMIVRSLLHRMGFRFRLRRKDLPGKPDVVLAKYKAAVFVHGCFWHRHEGCPQASVPKSNCKFWEEKFRKNVERDERNRRLLTEAGWRVFVVWECEIQRDPVGVAEHLAAGLTGKKSFKYDMAPTRREVLRAAEDQLKYRLGRKGGGPKR
jgi:DNA mismatch endonuclease (patch repair protein)